MPAHSPRCATPDIMQALTDFADQAVVLPLIAVVALMLGLLGWRRGALAWLGAVGLSFVSVLALKLVFATCGPALGLPALRSPSGHTAAAAVIAGGIAVVLGLRRQQIAAIAGLAAMLIGTTRVALGLHTPPEVALGGALGILGVLGFAVVAGKPPGAAVAVAVCRHRRGGTAAARAAPECRDDHPRRGVRPGALPVMVAGRFSETFVGGRCVRGRSMQCDTTAAWRRCISMRVVLCGRMHRLVCR